MLKTQRQIDRRRVRLLYETNSAMYIGGIVGVLGYAFVARNDLSQKAIAIGVVFMLAAFAFRYASQRYFNSIAAKHPNFKALSFERLHAFGLFLTASGWGVAGSFLMPEKHELVLVLCLVNVALISGGTTAYAISKLSTYCVILPMALPFAIASSFRHSETLMAMGLLTGLYAITMVRSAHKRRDFLLQAWKVAEEKEELSKALLETQAKATQSAKMAALGQMAAGIAHEINTPLAIIGVCAQSIQEVTEESPEHASAAREGIREYAEQIDATATRIAKIVAGLKNFSRADQNDPPREFDSGEMVRDTLELCGERFKRLGIDLRFDDHKTSAKILGHSAQLSQVLLNLLNNAADAIESSLEKRIDVALTVEGELLSLRVTDSGPGVPVALRSRLMEPFFTTKEFGKGTGLGLSVAHGIMVTHQGNLVLDEASDRTSFVMRLPVASAPEKSSQAA